MKYIISDRSFLQILEKPTFFTNFNPGASTNCTNNLGLFKKFIDSSIFSEFFSVWRICAYFFTISSNNGENNDFQEKSKSPLILLRSLQCGLQRGLPYNKFSQGQGFVLIFSSISSNSGEKKNDYRGKIEVVEIEPKRIIFARLQLNLFRYGSV